MMRAAVTDIQRIPSLHWPATSGLSIAWRLLTPEKTHLLRGISCVLEETCISRLRPSNSDSRTERRDR